MRAAPGRPFSGELAPSIEPRCSSATTSTGCEQYGYVGPLRARAAYIPIFPVAGCTPSQACLPAIALERAGRGVDRATRARGDVQALAQDFVRTAKGMPTPIVVLRHALRQELLPVVSYLGPRAPAS
jgi:ABC-type dipeptide/oligopeptide/nickel transport system permease component